MQDEFDKLLVRCFNDATEKAKKLETRPSNEDLLCLYGLYKQSTEGDCTTSKPSIFYVKDRRKWNVWNECKGISKDNSMRLYIEKVKCLSKEE